MSEMNYIVELFEESGESMRAFSDSTGIKYTTAVDIVKGKAAPENISMKNFFKIAKHFKMTADELSRALDGEEFKKIHDAETARLAEERELLGLFRSCNDEGRAAILASVRGLAATFPREADGAADE